MLTNAQANTHNRPYSGPRGDWRWQVDEFGVAHRPEPDRRTLIEHSADPRLDEAGRQLRAPWAAGLAGILFAVLLTGALLLMRSSPLNAANDAAERLETLGLGSVRVITCGP